MKSSDVFPSKYLKAADLDEDVDLTIRSVILEDIQTEGGLEQKPIVYFEEGEKGLLLNKTNWNALVQQYGDESDGWVGKNIVLTVMEVQFKDKMVPALRIKVPRSPTGKSPFQKKAPVEKSWPGGFVAALLRAKIAVNAAEAVALLNKSGLSEDVSSEEVVEIIRAMQTKQ
jgi:hypothetical protein